ncbi:26S proteasome non-ATPase regulatory subunit 13-like isoform X2 [Brienomyrus brachyistius]|uniref:26S proteasome non-ATPase regulatory subunit 13-like isoform X2 n=1 Tax=Brienomyrus brachyistius TaxID=42636 RepID=UPI0020B36AE3|nr:26S proteasome non-ATPase regulatory subunit 13-like isoform X2 [Brienomyrus brachyistius]
MLRKDAVVYLQEQQGRYHDKEREKLIKMEDLYKKRRWHQLTVELLDYVQRPALASDGRILKLYENFICDFEHRMNPLSLVEMILLAAQQVPDAGNALKLLEKTREKVKGNSEAVILCLTAMSTMKLKSGDLPAGKSLLATAETMLEQLPGLSSTHSRFYCASSSYYRATGQHALYYRQALRYLGCVQIKELSDVQQQTAVKLALAALLGDGLYNFGHLLLHPILATLQTAETQWLVQTLYAFNRGSVKSFDALRDSWSSQTDLAANEKKLRKKLQLLCLLEMIFTRPAHCRQMTFEKIAMETELPITEVELLVMKALSSGLVKGSIDEVDGQVHMTWVQPRVMDLQQICGMKGCLETWCSGVRMTSMLVENHADEVLGYQA